MADPAASTPEPDHQPDREDGRNTAEGAATAQLELVEGDADPDGEAGAPPRRRRGLLIGGIAVLVALVAGAVGGYFYADDSAQVASLERDLDSTTGELEEMAATLEETAGSLEDAEGEVDSLTADLEAAEARIEELTRQAEVPDYVGSKPPTENTEIFEDMGWKVKISRKASRDAAPGTVIAQTPKAGAVAKRGATINVTVAIAPPKAWVTTNTYNCQGGTVNTPPFTINSEARVKYTFGGSSNSVLWLEPADGGFGGDLLVNEIGAVSGNTRIYDQGEFYFEMMGDSCTVELQKFQ